MSDTELGAYPGAQTPDRQHKVDVGGLELMVHEWGDPEAPPFFFVHGGMDFARTYDEFAPRIASRGWRVLAWDQRGHGDSDHAALYGWDADLRDAMVVIDHFAAGRPTPVLGHSKGGSLMIQLADAQPYRFTHVINIDGIPSRRRASDVAEHERTKMLTSELRDWLAHRRRTAYTKRKPGTFEELAERRARMNPRLSREWLRHLVSVGAREDADGWRWKIDASMRFGGFGPWRPEWTLLKLPGLPMQFLGILGAQQEQMGWGTVPREVFPYLPLGGNCVIFEDAGHFVHIEQPERVSEMVLDFVGTP